MKHKYISSRLITGVAIILAFTMSNACSDAVKTSSKQIYRADVHKKSISVKMPENTRYFIAVDKNGTTLAFKGINSDGKIENSAPCAVCTLELSQKYGGFCEKLRDNKKLKRKVLSETIGKKYADLSFCSGTNKVEFLGIQKNDIIFTRMNPICALKIEEAGGITRALPKGCAE